VAGVSVAGPARADDGAQLFELVDAAAQRLQTADQVAATKWLSGGSITDPVRVEQVLTAVAQQAESAGVPADYVTTVFTDQINATEAIQYSRFSWWKFEPSAAPLTAPDLSASRELIDELNRRMVAEIAEDWPVLRAPDCDAALRSAKTSVAEARALDPLFRQALDVATRSYCD
jgi:chorismate mutase